MCHSTKLEGYLDLGFTPLADAFLTKYQLDNPETFYPLRVSVCCDCGHSQLTYVVTPEVLYQRNYPYESSTTQTGRDHYHEMGEYLSKRFRLKEHDWVIDVGSNVGVLLAGFQKTGVKVLGVDPATDMAQIANNNGILTLPTFFGSQTVNDIKVECSSAKVITGTNVFAHIDDLDDFMKTVDKVLDDEGVLVIEVPHFLELIRNLEYDTIYHEHLSYISIKPINSLFNRFGFEVFDVEKYPIHGGTVRIFASRKGIYSVLPSVKNLIDEEEKEGLFCLDRLQEFAKKVYNHKQQLINLLRRLKNEGYSIAGVSAPAKGNTLLNYCHVDRDLMGYITEKAKVKIGLYTPGTLIPVVDDSQLLEDQPDYALILAWNFGKEIMSNLSEYSKKGGKFIVPIPEPRVIDLNMEKKHESASEVH